MKLKMILSFIALSLSLVLSAQQRSPSDNRSYNKPSNQNVKTKKVVYAARNTTDSDPPGRAYNQGNGASYRSTRVVDVPKNDARLHDVVQGIHNARRESGTSGYTQITDRHGNVVREILPPGGMSNMNLRRSRAEAASMEKYSKTAARVDITEPDGNIPYKVHFLKKSGGAPDHYTAGNFWYKKHVSIEESAGSGESNQEPNQAPFKY